MPPPTIPTNNNEGGKKRKRLSKKKSKSTDCFVHPSSFAEGEGKPTKRTKKVKADSNNNESGDDDDEDDDDDDDDGDDKVEVDESMLNFALKSWASEWATYQKYYKPRRGKKSGRRQSYPKKAFNPFWINFKGFCARFKKHIPSKRKLKEAMTKFYTQNTTGFANAPDQDPILCAGQLSDAERGALLKQSDVVKAHKLSEYQRYAARRYETSASSSSPFSSSSSSPSPPSTPNRPQGSASSSSPLPLLAFGSSEGEPMHLDNNGNNGYEQENDNEFFPMMEGGFPPAEDIFSEPAPNSREGKRKKLVEGRRDQHRKQAEEKQQRFVQAFTTSNANSIASIMAPQSNAMVSVAESFKLMAAREEKEMQLKVIGEMFANGVLSRSEYIEQARAIANLPRLPALPSAPPPPPSAAAPPGGDPAPPPAAASVIVL